MDNGVVTKYYYAGGQRIAMRTGSALTYLLGDHLGSTSITTDSAGVKISELRYKPWGEVHYSWTNTPVTTPSYTLSKYTFTGQYSDSYINLLDYGSRRYDPELGRFIQPDSIVPVASQGVQAYDRYAYVNNNPVRYTDPSGHYACGDGEVHNCNGGLSNPRSIDHNSYCNNSTSKNCGEGYSGDNSDIIATGGSSGSNTSVKHGPISCPVQECQYTIPFPEEYGWDWGAYYYNNKTSLGYSILNPAGPNITVSNEGTGVHVFGFGLDRSYDYTTFESSINHNGVQSNLSFGIGASAEDLSVNVFIESSGSVKHNNDSGSSSTRQEFGVRPAVPILVFAAVAIGVVFYIETGNMYSGFAYP